MGLWTNGETRGKIIIFGAAWVALTTLWDKTTRDEMGLRFRNSKDSLWLVWPVTIAISFVWFTGLAAGAARDTYSGTTLLEHRLGYVFWAFCQQFLMQSYVFTRLQKLAGDRAPAMTAGYFSLAHVPNPALMVIALGGGWVSSLVFHHQRNLYALALAHGAIGATMASWWPSWVMRAGIGSFKWWNGSP